MDKDNRADKKTALEQMLDDLISVATERKNDAVLQQAQAFRRLIADYEDKWEADAKYKRRQYRDLSFSMMATVKDNPAGMAIIAKLSEPARHLLLMLLQYAVTQYISFSRTDAAALLGKDMGNLKRISKIIAELTDNHALYVVRPAAPRTAPIYRFSTALLRSGTTKRQVSDINDVMGGEWYIDKKGRLLKRYDNKEDPGDDSEQPSWKEGFLKHYVAFKTRDIVKTVDTLSFVNEAGRTIKYTAFVPIDNAETMKLTSLSKAMDNLTSKQKKSSADKPHKGSSQPTTNSTYTDDTTTTSDLSSLTNEQIEQYVQSMYCPEDDNSPSEAS